MMAITDETMTARSVTTLVDAHEVSEGAGVRVRRTLGTPELDQLDPFLLLDEFKSDRPSDYMAGFPDHPHRGFETVTYMLAGAMEHRDHRGNVGHLGPGSVQWMTAGRGIVHSEMPRQERGLMWGFQLWVNLPARLKMTEPRYQDIPAERIGEVDRDGLRVRVIAGEFGGVRGAVQGIATEPVYLDVQLAATGLLRQPLPPAHNAFCYVYDGEVELRGRERARVHSGQLAVLEGGEGVVAAGTSATCRFLLVAARPLEEPVVRYGPFVMNTREEIVQTIADFREGRF